MQNEKGVDEKLEPTMLARLSKLKPKTEKKFYKYARLRKLCFAGNVVE